MFLHIWRKLAGRQRANSFGRGRSRKSLSTPLSVELLEGRDQPSIMKPTYVLLTGAHNRPLLGSSSPYGLSPAQIQTAYGFNQITFSGGKVVGDGSGQTIAIIDAGSDPTLANDLHMFDQQYGLADPVLKQVNENGGSNLPGPISGWSLEISLDVEWAHAVAPAPPSCSWRPAPRMTPTCTPASLTRPPRAAPR